MAMQSQVVSTPNAIIRAWNDGLFLLRTKKNGITRGSTIEEKAMYVLGLGWKHRGVSEIRDTEIEKSLYISLQGLTQESKFFKIGQTLWGNCDPNFILQMISTLSTNTSAQSRLFQNISRETERNFNNLISGRRPSIVSMKERERQQLGRNAVLNRDREKRTNDMKRALKDSQMSSRNFNKKLVRFKTSNKLIRKAINELEIYLKRAIDNNEIIAIANDLGIEIESGFNKNYVIEEIKSVVGSYIEIELGVRGSSTSENIFIKPPPRGLERIKQLLRYTSLSILGYDQDVTAEELQRYAMERKTMEHNFSLYMKNSGKIRQRKLNKDIRTAEEIKTSLNKIRKNKDKLKKKQYDAIVSSLSSALGNVRFFNVSFNGVIRDVLEAENAYLAWADWNGYYSSEMGTHVRSNEDAPPMNSRSGQNIGNADFHKRLVFYDYNNNELIEKLMSLSRSIGITNTSFANMNITLSEATPGYWLIAIINRYIVINAEYKRKMFSIDKSFKLVSKKQRRESIRDLLATAGEEGEKFNKRLEKEKKLFQEVATGIFKPLSISGEQLRKWYRDKLINPVYVVGGSVYTFSGTGSVTGTVSNTGFIGGDSLVADSTLDRAFKTDKKLRRSTQTKINKGDVDGLWALGSQRHVLRRQKDESSGQFFKRLIFSKLHQEFRRADLHSDIPLVNSVQPVFVLNEGITTSNIELTALLNMLPEVLGKIPLLKPFGIGELLESSLQGQIDLARAVPKFARGGSFTTRNTNVSQFISGDSINNRINPERVTIDWATQRVNVQPLNQVNNVTNVETGKITDPIVSNPIVKIDSSKLGKGEAVSVYNSVNPFEEQLKAGNINATPMEVLLSLKESLLEIAGALTLSLQTEQSHATMTAKVVDGLSTIATKLDNNSSGGTAEMFANLGKLARGD